MKTLVFLMLMIGIAAPAWCQTKSSKVNKPGTTIEGEFRSVSGVMNKLSCYCSDGGYITTANGDEIAVCFEKNEYTKARRASDNFSCERIRVTGIYKTMSRESGENDPCPGGTMRVLSVYRFKCL